MSKNLASRPPATPAPPSFADTIEARDTCLCLGLHRAARALTREYDVTLRPAGLTSGQFSLLMSLNQPEAPRIGAVAALLAMDRTTLTANLKPLARRGLVEIEPDPADRRTRRLGLTPAGRKTLAQALPLWRQAQKVACRRLRGGDAGALREMLSRLG